MKKEKKILAVTLTCFLILTYGAEAYVFFTGGSFLPPLIFFIHVFLSTLGLVAVGFYPAYAFRLLYIKIGEKINRRIRTAAAEGRMIKAINLLNYIFDSLFWAVIAPAFLGLLIIFTVVFSGLLTFEAVAFILPPIGIIFFLKVDVEEKMKLKMMW